MPVTFCKTSHKFTVNDALNAITDLDDYVESSALWDDRADWIRLSGFELGMIKERLGIYGRIVALLEATIDDGESTDLHLVLGGERAEDFLAKFGLIARSIRNIEECADLYDYDRRACSICGKWESE